MWNQYQFKLKLRRSGLTSAVRIFVPLLCFMIISFITLMLTRPQGLFGRRELWTILGKRKNVIPDDKGGAAPPTA